MIVALDREALSALAGPASVRKQRVRRVLAAAARLRRDVRVPAVVLAELYRGAGRNQLVDACLARERPGLDVMPTDRPLARLVGGVLTAAGADRRNLVDAHVVALCVAAGGGIALTGDVDDLGRLAAPFPMVVVEAI
ncbi:MAG: PIN domain-containing protein [Acidimicrobiales bacterium]